MADLKLIALDADDLSVISAHLQDALFRVGDLAWLPAQRRFAAVGNRFDWAEALTTEAQGYVRRRAGLRFERVLAAQLSGIDLAHKETVLSLLAVAFEPGEPPAGSLILRFADGAGIRLQVECIEAELKDLGPAWQTQSIPQHDDATTPPRDA
jgi:hypothetical protein